MPLSISTAFYYADVSTMAKIAESLGKEEDAVKYLKLSNSIKEAFNERFYEPAMGYYDTGVQSAQAWPLAFGLTTEDNHESVSQYFLRCIEDKQRHLTTGYASTKFAIHALATLNRHDLITKLATSTEYPSWGFMLRLNRTTSCEQWNGERGSLNHAPLSAAIDEWFYWGLAGIQSSPEAPGFKKIIFEPHLAEGINWAKASIQTDYGEVSSHWEKSEREARVSVSVPAGTSAVLSLPCEDHLVVSEGEGGASKAEGVLNASSQDGMSRFEIGSGHYRFHWKI